METHELAMGAVGDVFNIVGAIGEYKNAREQGDNGAISLAKGIFNFTWGEFYYGGVARLTSERKFIRGVSLPGAAKSIKDKHGIINSITENAGVFSVGEVFGGAGNIIGTGVGGAIGGAVGGIGGTVASAFGKKGAIKAGISAGAKLGAKLGIASNFVGSMIPTMILSSAPQMIAQLPKEWEHTANVMTNAYRQGGKLGSGYFEMSQAGYTMRQRSLNAIRQNGLNTQSVLGNEARTYFRSSGLDY